ATRRPRRRCGGAGGRGRAIRATRTAPARVGAPPGARRPTAADAGPSRFAGCAEPRGHSPAEGALMSQQEDLPPVQATYEGVADGDVAAILAHVHDEVDWAADSRAAMAPWHGTRTGKDDVARFFAEIAQSLEVTEFTPVAMGASETEVFAFIRFGFRSPTSG